MRRLFIFCLFIFLGFCVRAQMPAQLKSTLLDFQNCEPCKYQLHVKLFDVKGVFLEEEKITFQKQQNLFFMQRDDVTYVQSDLHVVMVMHVQKNIMYKSYKKSDLPKHNTYVNWLDVLSSETVNMKWLPVVKDTKGFLKATVVFSNFEYQKMDFVYDEQKKLREVIVVTSIWNANFGNWQKGETVHIYYNQYQKVDPKDFMKLSSFCVLKKGKMVSCPKFPSYKIIQG